MANLQKIVPCLWFENRIEEAVKFYISVFKNSSIGKISYYTKEGFEIHKMPEGSILTIAFVLDGQNMLALNGGPAFKFNEAVSLVVNCDTQEEIDYFWEKLKEGGDENAQACGWLKDKFGLSWQIAPSFAADYYMDYKTENAQRAMAALLKMKKIDIAELEHAYHGS